MEIFNLNLYVVTPEFSSEEESLFFDDLDDAMEEADEMAFRSVGFPLEDWETVDFGGSNILYVFYPNEEDRSTRVKITVVKTID